MTLTGQTWSTGMKWDGFKPVGYSLDVQKVLSLQMLEVRPGSDEKDQEIPTTIGAVLQNLAERQVQRVESDFDFKSKEYHAATVTTDAGPMVFRGNQFNCDILAMVLDFRIEGINAFITSWFWYDSDSSTDDPHEMYSFFVANSDKIVRERFSISDHSRNGFDPTIFTAGDDLEPTWSGEEGWKNAELRFWYRKFYQETRTGQLMTLRSDEPDLYHYPEGHRIAAMYDAAVTSKRSDNEKLTTGRRSQIPFPEGVGIQNRLEKIHFVLWLLAVLAIVELVLRWR